MKIETDKFGRCGKPLVEVGGFFIGHKKFMVLIKIIKDSEV